MSAKPTAKIRLTAWQLALVAVILLAAVYLLASHWSTVWGGLQAAQLANLSWLGAALLLMVATFLVAAGIYSVLALHRLHFWRTVLVEVGSAFANRILPAGIGGLGLHGLYLYRQGHTGAEATAVVSANNLIGMTAHFSLLLVVAAVSPSTVKGVFGHHHLTVTGPIMALIAVGVIMVVSLPRVQQKVISFAKKMLISLRKLRLQQLGAALLLAMLLTLTYTAILVSVARSVGIELGWLQLFIVFSLGMLFSTATPTPGGLVGAEAGLFAGFVGYGVAASYAAAAVLLYRLITYWLPLLPGVVAVLLARHHKLV